MELIDKKALVKYLVEVRNKIYAGDDEYVLGQETGLVKAVDVIMTFPTVEERKHGHWIDLEFDDVSICSLCKNPQEVETLYCPECGAIMDGVEK